jgi:hypothetical protein
MLEYEHRSCLACQKRIPRWTDGKPTPKSKLFCGAACRQYHRRLHPVQVVRETPKKRPSLSALLEPVSAVEGRAEWRECGACGRQTEYRPGQPTFCSERCRVYVPPPPRKVDGDWFIVAGPDPLFCPSTPGWLAEMVFPTMAGWVSPPCPKTPMPFGPVPKPATP